MTELLEIVIERDSIQRMVQFEGESVLIGRGQDSDLRLEDPLASRAHCRIERLGAEAFLVDLDSANGTWIDGQRVQRRPLAAGDSFRIGSTTLKVTGGLAEKLAAIESTQTQQTSREIDMLQTLLAVMRAFQQEDSLERLAALLIDAAVSLTRAERGFVFFVERGKTTLSLGRNFAREPVVAPEQKVSRTLLGRALKGDGPLVLEDAASDGEFAGVASISDLGLRSILALPMRHHADVVGLLLVDHRLASGAFRAEAVELLTGLAGAAGMAVGSLRERKSISRLQRRNNTLQRQLGQRVRSEDEERRRLQTLDSLRYGGIVGASPQMQKLFGEMERVMEADVPVLVQGESGTGKELVARALHFGGTRSSHAFVIENCGALPDTLLESELFGHVKGAFTGATRNRAGRFEEADGGTLFLDEVSEMSTAMQQRLLRVLQEGEVRRLGSDDLIKVDVRVICATNVDLLEAIQSGSFREDLYYRLKVVLLELPPLRKREGDVALLAEHFLALEAGEMERVRRELSPEALAVLESCPWPGNVRQLRNEMRRLTLIGEGLVQVGDLSDEILHAQSPQPDESDADLPLPERVAAMEKRAIVDAMSRCHGNRSRAAQSLGISRFALLRKIEKYELEPDKEPADEAQDE